MGGKNKQRTKGNVRPSSSGRAAEVLTREGGVIPGFVGFGSTATFELSYVPAVHGAEDIDSLVDADFRMVLRKLSKKDVVTRLKAVQDFGSMCQEREAEEVKGVLPFWPRIYCKISMDHDRRIREATQQSFEQLVLKVRRSLAPFLKSLMGHWILSQCDTYSPAASAACQAFQAAFSPAKQPEALGFCKDEILNVLQDILLNETADSLSDPQNVTAEEREAKYLRMLTSSLLGVKKLLSLLLPSDRAALEDRLTPLLSSGKFWKYSKHKSPQVRGAFFEMVCSLCEFTPGLVQAEASRLCPAVLLSIDDTDPVVLPPVWEAVLHVVSTIPDCWTHVNARKGFLPKLWAVLKEGGKGMAKALHPNLMPLLSKLPGEVTEPDVDFYSSFFTALIQGLSSERALTSQSESAAIVTSFVECLKFGVLKIADDHDRIRSVLVSQQLLPLLERALSEASLQNGPLFYLLTHMLLSWERRAALSGDGEAPPTGEVFQSLLAGFWEELGVLCVRYVDDEEADLQRLEGLATLLQVMRSPETTRTKHVQKKKSARICFSKPEKAEITEEDGVEKPAQAAPQVVEEKILGALQDPHFEDTVCQLALICLTHVNERNSERHLVFLSRLMRSFHTPRLFRTLSEQNSEEEVKNNPAVQFLLERVVVWLAESGRRDTEHLVEMIFSSFHCCSQQEITRILSHVTTMGLPWGVLLQVIQRACKDSETLKTCRDWLKGSVLGEQLLDLTEDLCRVGEGSSHASASTTGGHSWTLISLVLSQNHNNESLIGDVYLEKILEKLHTTLSETKSLSDAGNAAPLVSFICDVASSFFSSVQDCLSLLPAEELLLTVFQLTAQDQRQTRLTDPVVEKLRGVCVAGVQSLVQDCECEPSEGGFLHSAAVWVKTHLLTASLDVRSLQVLVAAVQTLIETVYSVSAQAPPIISSFFNLLMPNQAEWTRIRQALPPQWIGSAVLSNNYRGVWEKPTRDMWKFREFHCLPAHLCVCALLGRAAQTAVSAGHEEAESSLPEQHLTSAVSELLYALQWCREFKFSPALVSSYHALLTEWGLSDGLHSKLPDQTLLERLYSKSLQDGGLWSLTLQNFLSTNNRAGSCIAAIRKLYGRADSLFPVSQSTLSTLQVIVPAMTSKDRETLITLATAGLINWQENDDVHGCLAVLLCCLHANTEVEEDIVKAVLATVMEWRNSREDWFLLSCDLADVACERLNLAVETIRFLSWLLVHHPTVLGGTQWDFVLCSVLAWLETCSESVGSLWNPWVQLFVCESAAIVEKLHQFFTCAPADVLQRLPPELTAEWTDFFVEGIYSLLLPLPVKITETFPEPDDPAFPMAALQSVGSALTYIPLQQLLKTSLPPRFIADQKTNLPESLQTLLNTLCPLLLFKARPLQVAVHHLLDKVMPQLPECDGEEDASKSDDDDRDEPCLSPPASLMAVLSACEELCENILAGVQVGEFAVVQPLSVEYSCILGYLLAWKLLLTFFKSSPSHLRAHYAQYLKRSGSLKKLLLHLFKLMPENPAYPGQGSETKDGKTFFTESLTLHVDKREGFEWELPHLACGVYYSTVQDLPAMVRLWWNSQEKRVSTAVERFTIKYVSPVLSAQEISSVHNSTQMFDSMTVKARQAAREVIATYSVDDIFIELVIQLPQNHPLGSIAVESGRRVGVAVQQWRNWMLQLSTYLTHQNGSIMEGLALWKNNVDKRFEGIEDCMICFSVIHGSNYSLPKKACRTCKKKFHSACLYKWFTSSNKSTCPLCRETFF
ncbi:E3 ubiquitin-protein ligase listerin [Oryzias melastigma]|uniref:E3 ubiquitin-protein ligase listerin n=1 Tax=Oryzias melastigma TaxID=30732 RepID=A0A834C9D9_ORYME|nr:E3 ubiquitin-protein ligase listerin [Oryzias melastigma]XP_024121685.1 E3 ubiquitin-protein ligase listerin [Oryzias melastigma]KAF6723533.1 E3 ubiquitin-protein ligase listerin [Oryzias melastigma]